MILQDFAVRIIPLSEADGGGFAGLAPELPGCRSDGETAHEALANIDDATGCWLAANADMGRAAPQPGRVTA